MKLKLSKLSKDELIALLVQYAEEIKEVEQALTLKFTDAGSKGSITQYKKLIRSCIKQHSDRHGFVPYRKVSYAVEGAEQVLEKAEEVLGDGQPLRAAEITFCVMHEMGELLQTCDDSDGIVGGMIVQSIDFVHQIACQLENSDSKERPLLFRLLLKEALHPTLEGWDEWQLSLLESAVCLMTNDAERASWSDLIGKMEEDQRKQSSHNSYFLENAALLRYQVIQKREGEGPALKFLQDHLDMKEFRKLAIEDSIANRQFDKALELALQGEQQDAAKGYPGLVTLWKQYRYQVYEETHQVEAQIKLAEEFALSGEYECYKRLRELHGEEEWAAAYKVFIEKLEHQCDSNWNTSSLYTRVLVEEKETLRLLDYVRKRRNMLVEFYPYLVGEYADEVFRLFAEHVAEEAARSSNRKEYGRVCGIIRHLIQAGGAGHAKEIIERLRLTYPNRSALLDELQKIY